MATCLICRPESVLRSGRFSCPGAAMTDLDRTVLGMNLDDAGSMDDLAQPLDAVIIVKGLSTSGDVSYWNAATLDLTTVECLGMVGYADIVLRNALNTDD